MTNRYILSGIMAISMAKQVRDSIDRLSGEHFLVTAHPEIITGEKELFMRYGNSDPVSVKDTEWNSREFIHTCAYKKAFSDLMREHNIYSPEFFRNPRDREYPLLIRETLSSFGGRGIHYIDNDEQFNRIWKTGFWWTPFIDLKFEMRAHIVKGEVIKLYIKKLLDGIEVPIRTNENTHWVKISNDNLHTKYKKLRELAKIITEITGGSFYGLDIGWDDNKKEYFVLEANSAPGLSLISSDDYASSILRGMGYDLRTNED
jgi:glutathione synthase/RimK-type ligase-like ATP-grasp enzyme